MIPIFDHTGPYIWAAYGLATLTLVALVAVIIARARAARARLERLQTVAQEDHQ